MVKHIPLSHSSLSRVLPVVALIPESVRTQELKRCLQAGKRKADVAYLVNLYMVE